MSEVKWEVGMSAAVMPAHRIGNTPPTRRTVKRVTKTQITLSDDTRWVIGTGREVGCKRRFFWPTVTPWTQEHDNARSGYMAERETLRERCVKAMADATVGQLLRVARELGVDGGAK